MAIPRVDYVPLPAVIPRRVQDTRTLGDLLRRQGENALQYELAKGQSAAQMWQQLGKLFSSYSEGTREDKANAIALQQRKDELLKADQLKRDEFAERKAEREAATQIRNDAEKRRQTEDAAKIGDAVAESVGYGPMNEPQMEQVLQSPAQAARARYSFGPGTAEGPELLPTRDQQADIDWRKQVEAKGGMVGPKGQAVMPPAPRPTPSPTEASLAVMAANGDRGAQRALEIMRAQHPKTETTEKPSLWVTKDGAQRYVTPTQAAQLATEGWRSGQGREQGRPVTSGDAGRVTEFDTSLDDLSVLRNTIATNGSTGTSAAIGAAMPAWATDLFGWGASAKSKNAMIARVKQVIGKALEGGVLRKEDEEKYKDILPTIQDANSLVLDKLTGLESAIAKRKQRHLDSLSDAGYDTTQFQARAQVLPNPVAAVPDLAGLQKGRGRRFSDGPFAGQTWSVDANGKPYKVGG